MNSIQNNQHGSSHIVISLLVVAFAVIGFAGYRVMGSKKTTKSTPVVSQTPATEIPAKITSKAEVKQADTALNAEQIDKSLDSSQLDADISALN